MVAVPTRLAVTVPPDTVATLRLEDFQVRALCAVSGDSAAERVSVSPSGSRTVPF